MKKIAVLDDEFGMRFLMEEAFKDDYEVYTFEDDSSIYELHEKLDMIVFDLNIGDKNGLEILKKLRSLGYMSKAVIISGHTDAVSSDRMKELEIIKVYEKPFNILEFKKDIDEII